MKEALNWFLWRTEQTYRDRAWRFARFLEPKQMEEADEEDVRRFLTRLATEQRVSARPQSQTVNALVFCSVFHM
ncbi:MAG: phage integrase N-terminal SAM-like domain-containing protein [Kiritimatiellae bacterium]|nr:phage integrase N-terminal SAM-like domain-containing protein [Kiritimatiellia bacterium]